MAKKSQVSDVTKKEEEQRTRVLRSEIEQHLRGWSRRAGDIET